MYYDAHCASKELATDARYVPGILRDVKSIKYLKYNVGLPLKVVRTPFGYMRKKSEDRRFKNT